MRFFMLSDFHLGQDAILEKAKEQLMNLCSRIRSDINPDEVILFILMGDIVNKSDVRAFDDAKVCLDCIREGLAGLLVKFEFVPGNHDIPSGDILPFDGFIAEYNPSCSFKNSGAYSAVYEDVNFIFADSNILRDHSLPGKLDLEAIRHEIKPIKNILFCHHGFEQSYGGDHDTVNDAGTVLNRLKDMGIDFVFHGHTHRAEASYTKNGIVEIGCGTIHGDISWMDGIQNQFSVGYIRDKKIINVDRFVISKDGGGVFPKETIYPKQKIFLDPWSIRKIQYGPVLSYIKRKVISHAKALEGEYAILFSKENLLSLREVLLKERKVLFLSDAGQGKSVEMENLAYELCQTNYFPVLFKLRNYNGTKIEDLFPQDYKSLSPKLTVLLLDGYDELPSYHKRQFENELRLFLNDNPNICIVISSRSNFCRTEKDVESKTFPGFKIYDLCKLSREDIKSYVEEQGINSKRFFYDARMSKVDKLLENPFYLIQICMLFMKNGNLPVKAELMDKLIEASFSMDDEKFSGDLEERYMELMKLLRKVAFAMQLMQQSKIDSRTEYQSLFNNGERELLTHSGLFIKEGDSWFFLHNNFREYLAAKYLSELSQEDIISYIYNGENINPSWVNTLGFLTGISLNWDLNKWIAQNVPAALVKFDTEQVDQVTRYNVLKDIFNYYEKRYLWFNDELCDEEQLANFAHSASALTFLLNKIANPVHVVSQYTAIRILRFFPTLYGRNKEVLECLLACCKNYPETRSDVCRVAIMAIHRLGLDNHDVTLQLLELFEESDNDYIRVGMYEYFLETGQQNEYVHYFLQGIKYIIYKSNDDENRIGDEAFQLAEGLKAMSSVDSISLVLMWITDEEVDFHDVNEIYGLLMKKALGLYLEGNEQLYDVVMHECTKILQKYDTNKLRSCVEFFEGCGLLEKTFVMLTECFSTEEHYLADLICLKPELPKVILKMYKEEKFDNHDAFRKIIQRYVGDEQLYNECKKALFQRTGVLLPEFEPRINYEELRREARQTYFDSIFIKEQMELMLSELLKKMNKTGVVIKDIFDVKINLPVHSQLRNLRTAIYHSGHPDRQVKDFFSDIVYERFILTECERILKNNKDIVVSTEQVEMIRLLITQCLTSDCIRKEVRHRPDGMVCTRAVLAMVRLVVNLDIALPVDVALELTNIAAPYFSEGKDDKKYNYLLRHIPIDILKKRIAENLEDDSLDRILIEDHIDFCKINNFEDATNRSLLWCQSVETDRWIQMHAFDYLYSMYGASYVKEFILPYATGEFLLEIADKCKDAIPRVEFCSALEKEYGREPSYGVMERLIAYGSEIGITRYVEMVLAECKIPEGQCHSHTATSSIKYIDNPKYLPLLEQLLDVAMHPDFVDDEFWGLRSSLKGALVNCGMADFDSTIEVLNRKLLSAELEEHNIRYCNYIIEEIKANKRKYSDCPKTIQQVKSLLGIH